MTKKDPKMDETSINQNLGTTLEKLNELKKTVTTTVATANTTQAESQVDASLRHFLDAVDQLKIALLHRIKH